MNNDGFENKNKNNGEEVTEDIIVEANEDVENREDVQKGEKEDSPFAQEKETADGEKEKDPSQEKEDDQKKAKENLNGDGGFSSNYTPPYYVPNFTVYNGDGTKVNDDPPKKEKRKYGIGVIAIVCVACILISATLGAIAGAIAGGGFFLEISPEDGEIVNIVRSDRNITVEELPGNTGLSNLTVAQVAALVGESVVEITTTHVQTNTFYGQYITSGAGSGVIFDQQENYAYIVTNYHVIEGADEITVRVKNGSSYKDYKAEYLAGDQSGDLAVIRISGAGETFSTAIFGDSDKLIVGEEVVAIGNPLGSLGGTVTNGIISALDREITIDNNTMTLLQTNTAINPGNSGGGLFNMAGELIGIVNAKQASTGIEGLGFAIPANKVVRDITDILERGYVSGRATLGIGVQEGTRQGQAGVYVTQRGSTAFEIYDRIVQIGDTEISSLSEYNAAMKKLEIGQTVTVKVARGGKWHYVDANVLENTNKY